MLESIVGWKTPVYFLLIDFFYMDIRQGISGFTLL
jgi:hypothetical protein